MSEAQGNSGDPHAHGPAAPPEPTTPMWLPALGAALFLAAGLLWGLLPSSKPAEGDTAPAGSVAADAGAPAKK